MKLPAQIALVLIGGAGAYALARLVMNRGGTGGGGAPAQDACDALQSPEAVAACKAARGVFGVASYIGGAIAGALTQESGSEANAHNIPLNGEIVGALPLDARFHANGQGYYMTPRGNLTPGFKGREVPIYKNGCVPLQGDPRFKKCAPDTHAFNHGRFTGAGNGEEYRGRNDGTGQLVTSGDPLTHRNYGSAYGSIMKPFPLQCTGTDEAWWLSGKPACCPKDAYIARRHNADGSVTSVCTNANYTPPKTPAVIAVGDLRPNATPPGGVSTDCRRIDGRVVCGK